MYKQVKMYATTPYDKPVGRIRPNRKYSALINRLTTDVGCQGLAKLANYDLVLKLIQL